MSERFCEFCHLPEASMDEADLPFHIFAGLIYAPESYVTPILIKAIIILDYLQQLQQLQSLPRLHPAEFQQTHWYHPHEYTAHLSTSLSHSLH